MTDFDDKEYFALYDQFEVYMNMFLLKFTCKKGESCGQTLYLTGWR